MLGERVLSPRAVLPLNLELGTSGRALAVRHGALLAGLIVLAWHVTSAGHGFDAYAYWSVDLAHLYSGNYGERGFFPYSPAAALAVSPLGLLPWPIFLLGWQALLLGALLFVTRSRLLWALAFPPVAFELVTGNIHLLMAAAIVVGFRYPAAWALILLTKVTPGIGLLWFVVRREWRNLAIAVGATVAIIGATFFLLPEQWQAWLTLLHGNGNTVIGFMGLRVVAAAALIWWGARRDAYWTVPVAATIALPSLLLAGLSLLVACVPLRGTARGYYVRDARPAGRRLALAPSDDHPARV